MTAALHGNRGRILRLANTRKATRHHDPALRRPRQIDAQRCRPGLKAAIHIDRGGGQLHGLLADKLCAILPQPRDQLGAFLRAERRAQYSVALVFEGKPRGERRSDDHVVEIVDHVLAFRRLPAPPCRNRRQHQVLATQPARKSWQEGQERPRFHDARAERVDHRDRALPNRLRQPRRADARTAVELQRIGKGRIEAAPYNADRLQPGDGANHQPAVGDREVLALEQHDAEIAGDVSVLIVRLVERSRRHDRDAPFRIGRGIDQRVTEAAEEAREAMDMHLAIDVGQRARRSDTVFQGKTGARRRLRPVAEHPPAAIRTTRHFESAKMQEVAISGPDPGHGPQILRAGCNQTGWQKPLQNKLVVTINVGNDCLEQVGPLDQSCADRRPFGFVDKQRNMR